MKEHGRKLLIFTAVAVFGFLLLKLSGHLVKKETLERYRTLCANADSTVADIGENAEVYTLQRRTIKANLYKYTYTYVVKGREYTAEKSSLSDKPDMELPIWFNKNDPADSMFESPCDWMAKNGNSFAVSGFVDKSIFFIGLIMLLYGGWKTLTSFVRLIISAFKKEQPST